MNKTCTRIASIITILSDSTVIRMLSHNANLYVAFNANASAWSVSGHYKRCFEFVAVQASVLYQRFSHGMKTF